MIPSAFYDVKYHYDRQAKRWSALFTSLEHENIQLLAPLRDDMVHILGENVECDTEEDLALMFLQFVDVVSTSRVEAAKAAKEQEAQKPPEGLTLLAPESPPSE